MNNTTKALCVSGVVMAVLTSVLIAGINDARKKLDQAVIDNARQDSEIKQNTAAMSEVKSYLKDIMNVSRKTNEATIRLEERALYTNEATARLEERMKLFEVVP